MRILRVFFLNLLLSAIVIASMAFLLELDRTWLAPLPLITEILAWPFFVSGTILILWAVFILFKYSGSSGAPGDPTRKLVTQGPYEFIRNPVYLGDILLLFGLALFTSSFLLLLVALEAIIIIHLLVCYIEEPKTEERFGEPYRAYMEKVPRWIPRISIRVKGKSKHSPR